MLYTRTLNPSTLVWKPSADGLDLGVKVSILTRKGLGGERNPKGLSDLGRSDGLI